jgi:hypothetical protein
MFTLACELRARQYWGRDRDRSAYPELPDWLL